MEKADLHAIPNEYMDLLSIFLFPMPLCQLKGFAPPPPPPPPPPRPPVVIIFLHPCMYTHLVSCVSPMVGLKKLSTCGDLEICSSRCNRRIYAVSVCILNGSIKLHVQLTRQYSLMVANLVFITLSVLVLPNRLKMLSIAFAATYTFNSTSSNLAIRFTNLVVMG